MTRATACPGKGGEDELEALGHRKSRVLQVVVDGLAEIEVVIMVTLWRQRGTSVLLTILERAEAAREVAALLRGTAGATAERGTTLGSVVRGGGGVARALRLGGGGGVKTGSHPLMVPDGLLYGEHTMITACGFDIKEMFTSLPHAAVMEGVHWLLKLWEEKGYHQITVSRRGKLVSMGVKLFGKGYVKIKFRQILQFVAFELRNTYTSCKGKLLGQRIGLPMGKNSSPPLTCILCAKFEVEFLASLGRDRRLVHGVWFMDDVSLAVVFNRRKEGSVQKALLIMEKFKNCYGSKLSQVRTNDGSNTIDFIGARIIITEGRIRFILEPKAKNECTQRQEELTFRCFQDFCSYWDKRAKIGAITGSLHRIRQMANCGSMIILPVIAMKQELLRRAHPPTLFFNALARFAKGTMALKEPWRTMLECMVQHVKQEKNILRKVDYPFIVNLLGYCQDPECVHLVLEYVVGKKALDIEAKLGSAHQTSHDGGRRLPQDWKKKGQLMFVDHDGKMTEIDDFPDLGEVTEHDGASETSDGGVVTPIKEKARGTGKKKVVRSTGQGDQGTPAWVKLGLEYEAWRDRVARGTCMNCGNYGHTSRTCRGKKVLTRVVSPTVVGLPSNSGGVVEREVVHAIEVVPGSKVPRGRIYRMSPAELNELHRELTELTEKGWIQPSTSPYGAPVLFVPKKGGTLRMCIDYRGLNAITVKNTEPLPRIDDLLDRVLGCRYFTKIVLKFGYHQIAIRPEDQRKTTFQTRYGLYEFVVMPFGLCNAPGTFQHAMNRIFHDYLDKFIVVYLDDILIFSRTVEEHVEHLKTVLGLLRQHQYKVNLEKCEFGRTKILYLGHEISADGLRSDDAKVASIRDWPRPQTVTKVRSFLGMTDYYRPFVKNYSTTASPLTDLTRLDTPWEWIEECEATFRKLKYALTHYEVLKLPDPDKSFVVTTDASQYGIGAVLAQTEGPKLRPIEYMSKKMSSQKLVSPLMSVSSMPCTEREG
ncbi:hypothetical protein CBR_g25894 [Chara braunii]|uniref:Reverse transcriptase domain-containing protein n=1 Tax=Chara braunii TaxID=69332 RepID=A0A388L6Y4_CHABU|nr:hypothetical protein CBR_g25894 [Chara braunii]|eukprot:GBG77963.1 hypothetical protein CBR_g25894 [Chara braunii]